MFEFLRKSEKVIVLKDCDAFWEHCNRNWRTQNTPEGAAADAEERLDLQMGQAIKALLEIEVGPEEGPNRVHIQNWDWNDDRRRCVAILKKSFKPDLIPKLLGLLENEFYNFQIVVTLCQDWEEDDWGHFMLSNSQIAFERKVAQTYALA